HTSFPVPRGKMYDRNGKAIVDNTPLNAITYTKKQNADPQQMLKTAEKLSKLIDIGDTSKIIHDRDKQDFWILKNPEKAKGLITKKEWSLFAQKKLDDKQIYNLQLKRITNKELTSLNSNTVAIFRQFNSGYALTPQIVKNKDVTPQEY